MTKHEVSIEHLDELDRNNGLTATLRWRCTCGGRGQWWLSANSAESAGKAHADYHNNKRRK